MAKHALKLSFVILFFSQNLLADVMLPIWEVKNQGDTDHCWAYSSTQLLESRSLVRDQHHISLNVEKDVKYWVDFERLMYIYQTKKPFYFGEMEGGWQAEFMETLVKHGKSIASNTFVQPEITYQAFDDSNVMTEFSSEPRPEIDSELPTFDEVKAKMINGFETELEARFYALNFLNRYYGKPTEVTNWDEQEIPIEESGKLILGTDYDSSSDAFILIKPTDDGNFGWTRFLSDRYVGYRYDHYLTIDLVKLSLDRGWPITFDNIFHAMTIVAYKYNETEMTYYFAVTDSLRGILWQSSEYLLASLNLVTFAKPAIIDQLDPELHADQSRSSAERDLYDNVVIPPR